MSEPQAGEGHAEDVLDSNTYEDIETHSCEQQEEREDYSRKGMPMDITEMKALKATLKGEFTKLRRGVIVRLRNPSSHIESLEEEASRITDSYDQVYTALDNLARAYSGEGNERNRAKVADEMATLEEQFTETVGRLMRTMQEVEDSEEHRRNHRGMEYREPGRGGSDEWQNFCLEPARYEQAPCDIPSVGFQHALVQQAAVPQQYAHTTGVDATIANQEKSPQKGALRQVLSTMTTQATQPCSNTKGDSTVAAPSTIARPTARFSAPSTSRQPSVTASNTLWSTQEQPATMPGTSSTLPTHNPRSLNSGKELWHHLKPFAMPKFDGTKREYASWKAAFQACVDNAQVTPEQKLLQLHNYLTGDALKAISGLGYSAAAYKVAIDRLERKYGGQRRQIALQLEAVEAFPTVRNGRADDLEKLADLLDVTIVNLTDGGQQSELSGSILFAKLQGKLPVILLRQYHHWCYERSMPETVMSLLEWVTLEAEFATSAAELIHGVDKLPSSSQQRPNGPAYRPAHHTFAGYESDNRECTICTGEHAVHQCQGFLQHDVAKRWVIAKNSRLCYRCLQPGHRGNQCASNHRCGVQGCTDTHNPLLHWNMVTKRTPASVAPRSRRAPRSPLPQSQDSSHMAHVIPTKTPGVELEEAAREKSENELGLLQNALKAVEMQKTQLLASNQNLQVQLEEVNSQLVTSRQNCRDMEDRVITLSDNLDAAKRQSTEHNEARKKLEATAAEQEEKLVTTIASLGSVQDKFEESIQAKEALEIQVADVNKKLNTAVAKCAELEQTLLDSDSSLRDELSKQQEIQREQKEDLEATIQRL